MTADFEQRPGGEAGGVRSLQSTAKKTRREAALEAARVAGAEIEERADGTTLIVLPNGRAPK
jgi:hypothetical protein